MMLDNLKICGITSHDTARYCAGLGVGALGAVFFAKSPRNVSPQKARELFEGLPETTARVGVFVDRPTDELLAIAREARLTTVQLHGSEPIESVRAVLDAGYRVIRVLKVTGEALLAAARQTPPEVGLLVECGQGRLPGGNGATWNWSDAAPLAGLRPFAIAGGLGPQSIAQAAAESRAVAWDVSSGVESSPGVKDHAAIARLAAALTHFQRPLSTPVDPSRFWSPSVGPTRSFNL